MFLDSLKAGDVFRDFSGFGADFPRVCTICKYWSLLTHFWSQILKYVEKESEVEKIASQKPRYPGWSKSHQVELNSLFSGHLTRAKRARRASPQWLWRTRGRGRRRARGEARRSRRRNRSRLPRGLKNLRLLCFWSHFLPLSTCFTLFLMAKSGERV